MHFHLHAVADKAKQAELKAYWLSHPPIASHTLLLLWTKYSLKCLAVRRQVLATVVKLEDLLLIIVLLGKDPSARIVISPNSSVEQTRVC